MNYTPTQTRGAATSNGDWQQMSLGHRAVTTIVPTPTPDASYEYQNASGAYGHLSEEAAEEDEDELLEAEDEEEEEEEVDGDEDEEEEEGEMEADIASETSSAMYDADADPTGFARRQDELAGIMEMGEEEARAMRRGPPFGRDRHGQSTSRTSVMSTA